MANEYTQLRKDYPRTWRIWYRMNRRCDIGQNGDYVDVEVCDAWNIHTQHQQGFINFLDDMGPSEGRLEIDRINPLGDYELENCRWVEPAVNRRNTRARHRGDYKWLDVAKANGIKRVTFYHRLYRGWTPQDAATLPVDKSKYRNRLV